MRFDADLTACAALVEKGDPDRFAAAMASPVAARRVLFPLYAFNVEVSRAPWVTQEPMIAEMRLQWWRDALEEIGTGAVVRRHEVVTPLASIIDAEGAKVLDRLVAARRWDIYKDAFEDAGHFESYLNETAAGLMWVAARALGVTDTGGEGAIRKLGRATGLARFLQAVPALEAQGRIPLVDGRAEAISLLAQTMQADCPSAREVKSILTKTARPAMTEAFLTNPVLSQIAKEPQRVADDAIAVHPLRRSYLLWKWS
ncbi:MAG: squalene/phytoene synthase family protein [Paracoccaceae bacterium]|nr:squalene/phytoene synthase family protein [Paracoccaceae bacterium]